MPTPAFQHNNRKQSWAYLPSSWLWLHQACSSCRLLSCTDTKRRQDIASQCYTTADRVLTIVSMLIPGHKAELITRRKQIKRHMTRIFILAGVPVIGWETGPKAGRCWSAFDHAKTSFLQRKIWKVKNIYPKKIWFLVGTTKPFLSTKWPKET